MTFSTDLPSPADQRDIIKSLEQNNPRKEGTDAFLISLRWYLRWQSNVGWLTGIPAPDGVACGPIDNTPLLRNGEFDWGHKKEFTDFAILVEAVWNQLFLWYGGGPPIAVPIGRGPFNSLVVAWPKFPVTLLYRNTEQTYAAGRSSLIGDIHAAARGLFRVSDTEKTQIRESLNGLPGRVLEDSRTSESCGLRRKLTLLDRKSVV
jgi:hypothetical protein